MTASSIDDLKTKDSPKLLLKQWAKSSNKSIRDPAKLGARLGARIVDVVFIGAISTVGFYLFFIILGIFFVHRNGLENLPDSDELIRILVFLLQLQIPVSLFLVDIVTVAKKSRSIGKSMANIKVASITDKSSPGFLRSFFRSSILLGLLLIQSIFLVLAIFMGDSTPQYMKLFTEGLFVYLPLFVLAVCLVGLFVNKCQGLHDIISKTAVIIKYPHFYSFSKLADDTTEKGYALLQTGSTLQLASCFSRFIARGIDLMIISFFLVTFFLLSLITVVTISNGYIGDLIGPLGSAVLLALFALIAVLVIVYYENALIVMRGQTLGKMAMNIKVIRSDDAGLPDWNKAAARMIIFFSLGGLFSSMTMLWDKERQAVHDMGSSTFVVQTAPPRLRIGKLLKPSTYYRKFLRSV